ncbi:MAG: SpoIID/LytB domain-containing protein, partial [Clostridia bacterium]|nr:SpoIID/LytB domain-containing protein [Clostridia bacterium]
MKIFIRLCIITTILIFCISFSANAVEYHDTLRVGIYYGPSAVNSLTIESYIGFEIGYSTGRDSNVFEEISNTSVTVSKNSTDTYHLLYSTCESYDELSIKLSELRELGINAFPAYFDSSYCAFGGVFASQNDAQWQAENGSFDAIAVTLPSSALCITDTKSGNLLFVSDSTSYGVSVFSLDNENPDSLLSISGSAKGTYRCGFECRLDSSGALTVVNIVPVESYLYSVVCREMSSSWPVEALKAQAVCARNFALGRINYHKQYGFDICRTVCCQAYSTTA